MSESASAAARPVLFICKLPSAVNTSAIDINYRQFRQTNILI
jgi:hypothetical protein